MHRLWTVPLALASSTVPSSCNLQVVWVARRLPSCLSLHRGRSVEERKCDTEVKRDEVVLKSKLNALF